MGYLRDMNLCYDELIVNVVSYCRHLVCENLKFIQMNHMIELEKYQRIYVSRRLYVGRFDIVSNINYVMYRHTT